MNDNITIQLTISRQHALVLKTLLEGLVAELDAPASEDHRDIDALVDVSIRTRNALRAAGFNTLEHVRCLSRGALQRVPNLGRKSMETILEALKSEGYYLRD